MIDTTLSYAVRARVVGKYLGQLGLTLAMLSLLPLAAALLSGDHVIARRYLTVVGLLTLGGLPLARLPAPARVQTNEALSVVGLVFLLGALATTWPFMGAGLAFDDALFESVSAITTTGLSMVPNLADKPAAFLLARAWTQWYGGLGIAVLSVALLMGHHIAARRLVESPGGETLLTTTRTHARRVLGVYVVLSVLGVVLLWLASGDGFTALTHTLAAVSTGGFTPDNASLTALDGWFPRYTAIGLGLLGAISLPLYLSLKGGDWRRVYRDVELRALIVLCLLNAAVLAVLLHRDLVVDWLAATRHALLLGISAQTTTGFTTVDVAAVGTDAKLILILSMFIGGSLGSTAGGIKLLRLLILLRLVRLAFLSSTLPQHAVVVERLGGRRLDQDDLQRALLLIHLYLLVIAVSWLMFLFYGYAPLDALFEVVSATATVGLSAGIVRPELEPVLKGVLCADMLLGRLEIVAVLVLLYPRNWFGKRTE